MNRFLFLALGGIGLAAAESITLDVNMFGGLDGNVGGRFEQQSISAGEPLLALGSNSSFHAAYLPGVTST